MILNLSDMDKEFFLFDVSFVKIISHTLLVIWFLPGMVGNVCLSPIAKFAIWFLSGMDKMFALMCIF